MGSGARTRIQPPGRRERRGREREGERGWVGGGATVRYQGDKARTMMMMSSKKQRKD